LGVLSEELTALNLEAAELEGRVREIAGQLLSGGGDG